MTKHIHIHIHPARPTRDAGTAHDPSNGQFTTSGTSGSGREHHEEMARRHRAAIHSGSTTAERGTHSLGIVLHERAARSGFPADAKYANQHSAMVEKSGANNAAMQEATRRAQIKHAPDGAGSRSVRPAK